MAFRFEIGAPGSTDHGRHQCSVYLLNETQKRVIVDNPIYGEDDLDAVKQATDLIRRLSGWL